MQHLDETLANIRLENMMKHLEHTLETYVYSKCNVCNISIYLCNIKMKHLQYLDETPETLEAYYCNMGFAWTNGGTLARRSTARHGPHCVAAARVTRPQARRHTNIVPLAYLLEHPSWRLAGSEEAGAARQLGGGGRGERASYGEEVSRWRRARQIVPGGNAAWRRQCGEAAQRRP
jgi:hypothetical protein